ncbi:MAG: hypothetical protein ABIG10_01240 [bacterium]
MIKLIKKIKQLFKDKQFGFNMIEIIIMISLLTLTFIAVMSLIMKTVELEYVTKTDFIAISLAKEGIELVEEIRNDNIKNGWDFYQDISCASPDPPTPPATNNETCYFAIDYKDYRSIDYYTGIEPIPDVNNLMFNLKFDSSDFYQYTTGDLSNFYRKITTVYHDNGTVINYNDDYLYVISEVYWEYKGKGYTYTEKTVLNNIR